MYGKETLGIVNGGRSRAGEQSGDHLLMTVASSPVERGKAFGVLSIDPAGTSGKEHLAYFNVVNHGCTSEKRRTLDLHTGRRIPR